MSTPKKHEPHPPETEVHHDEEVVHVPKGTSKVKFLLTIGLMLFVLVIFTVGDQFMGTFGGRRGPSAGAAYMTWEHPGEGTQSIAWNEFVAAKRSIDDFFRVQGARTSREQTEDDNIAYLLITDRMARDAGIQIAQAELGRILREGQRGLCTPFFNEQNYRAALAREGVTAVDFEATLAWLLRVTRYEGLMCYALATPAPAAIEAAWKAEHQEYSFTLAGYTHGELRDQAALEEPDDATLSAWYDGLGATEKGRLFREHYTPERRTVELLSWAPGSALPEGLLERFPAPEGSDPATAGRNYYDLYQFLRFRRPEPGDDADGEAPDDPYLPYDEVAADAADQARVRAALAALLDDLRARKAAGEELDLASLAGELGLELTGDGLPRSQDEWGELVDAELLVHLRAPGAGNLFGQPVVGSTRLWIGRVLETQPSAPPAYADIQAEAREAWLDQRARELARERLDVVFDALVEAAGETPAEGSDRPLYVGATEEQFAAAVADAGLELHDVDWFDPARLSQDRSVDESNVPLHFLTDNYFPGAPLFSIEAGQVASPREASNGESVWLVRTRGARDPAEADMRPAEYQSLRQQVLFDDLGTIYQGINSPEALAERFGLAYPGRVESEDDAGDQG